MSSFVIAELILLAVVLTFFMISIMYEKKELSKLKKRIQYSSEEGKNYEYILTKLLNK